MWCMVDGHDNITQKIRLNDSFEQKCEGCGVKKNDELWCGYVCMCLCVFAVQIRNDGVDHGKAILRKGFDGAMVPIKNARGTVQTRMISCGVVICVSVCVCVYVCMFAVQTRNVGVDHVKGR